MITANIAGVAIDEQEISKAESTSKEFLAKNMFGSLPYLEREDGEGISSSSAIAAYIASHSDKKDELLGKTPFEKAKLTCGCRL